MKKEEVEACVTDPEGDHDIIALARSWLSMHSRLEALERVALLGKELEIQASRHVRFEPVSACAMVDKATKAYRDAFYALDKEAKP